MSPYQKILIVHSQSLGNLLVLDGLQSKFLLFRMCTCFISVLYFCHSVTYWPAIQVRCQDSKVWEWCLGWLGHLRFTEFQLNMKLWIVLCWFLPLHYFELKPGVPVILHTMWIDMFILKLRGGLWWKYGNVCIKYYKVKEVFVYIGLLNITLHEYWIKLNHFSQQWFSPQEFCMSYDVLLSCLYV
jgi:hypothetical protein